MSDSSAPNSLAPIKIAVRLPHSWCGCSAAGIRRVAETAEELGFWAVSVHDHLLVDPSVGLCTGDEGDPRDMYEALATLTWVAGFTRRVRLLTTVIVLGFRHPVVLAKETSTLDVLSEGRLVLGVGVGALRKRAEAEGYRLHKNARIATAEFDALGVMGHRGRLGDEHIRILKALWTKDRTSFEGEFANFQNWEFYPKPVQRPHPPILVGGRSEAAFRRTALLGDGWVPSHESPEHYAYGRSRIEALAAEAGRPAPQTWGVNIDATIAERDEVARELLARAYRSAFVDDSAMYAACLAGSPDAWIDQIRRWRSAGVDLVDLKLVPLDPSEMVRQLKLIAKEVMPALRDL